MNQSNLLEFIIGNAIGNPLTYVWILAGVAIYIRGMKWAGE